MGLGYICLVSKGSHVNDYSTTDFRKEEFLSTSRLSELGVNQLMRVRNTLIISIKMSLSQDDVVR